MDYILINLVFISYLMFGANAEVSLKVSNDITVKPTPDPVTDVTEVVNVTLRCEGSKPDLSYYIHNPVSWTFISATGKQLLLSEGFYATQDAKHLFSGTKKRFVCSYVQTETGYAVEFNITKVTRSDEGIYRCSIKNSDGDMIDSKDIKLTVVNPVQTLAMELYDGQGNLVAESTSPVNQTTPPVHITPGHYSVKCIALGSNPGPVMNLFLNEFKPYVAIEVREDNSTNYRSYIGSFAENLTISSKSSRQGLVCAANIPGGYYASGEAGIALLAHSDKPTIVCENTTAALADRYCLIKCRVTKESQIGALRCDRISWSLGSTGRRIEYEQIWKDQSNGYGDMESTCMEKKDGLSVTLNIFTVTSKVFEDSLSLVYEYDAQKVSYSVDVYETVAVDTTMHDTTVTLSVTDKAVYDTAAVFTPLSLSVYLVVVVTAGFTL